MQPAIVRLVVLIILLANQALITLGWEPFPFSEEEIYTGVSTVATIVMTLYAWWKDNPVSRKARYNEEYLKEQGLK
ncbi:phage holin [Gracilibacillus alcaliphilus]|uniref:phage holin n=1 Tax=Gracilibacillus alcaliphilus TaxID=1401441 RepID=UPI001959D6D5|nr:phage holin [Gracilibacillus alcaliphilus]MBM7678368.1 SPP1 family holin [Gracilibacillus alcaliphilus]